MVQKAMSAQRAVAERFVRVTEGMGWTPELASELLHPEYVQTELPNLLNRNGQTSTLEETLARNEVARKILASQSYEITSVLESGATLVMEARWSGEMAIAAGPLAAGQVIRAHFCMVFDFEDGRIRRIRNYDCFEPF